MGPKGKSSSSGKGKNAPPPAPQPDKGGKKGGAAAAGGGKKKGDGKAAAGTVVSDKQSKAARKLERDEREKQRVADRDDMMNGMPSYDSEEEEGYSNSAHVEFPGVSRKKAKDLTTDKFGNTVSKSKNLINWYFSFVHVCMY